MMVIHMSSCISCVVWLILVFYSVNNYLDFIGGGGKFCHAVEYYATLDEALRIQRSYKK